MVWRDYLDERIKPHLERLIIESINYNNIYSLAKDKGKAQLWIALAILHKQLHNANLKIDYLEKALQDVAGPKLKKKELAKRKKEEKEVEKFIKELAGGRITKSKKEKKKKKNKTRKKRGKKFSEIKIAKSL